MRTHREPSWGESARQEKQTHAQTTGTHNGKLLIWPERAIKHQSHARRRAFLFVRGLNTREKPTATRGGWGGVLPVEGEKKK